MNLDAVSPSSVYLSWNQLPFHILNLVFKHLQDPGQQCVLSEVCKKWSNYIQADWEKKEVKLLNFLQDRTKILSLNVAELDLNFSSLNYLPTSIFLCKNIITLNLAGNNLKDLPVILRYCKRLTVINLQNNQFKSIPLMLFLLKNLKEINLLENPLITNPTLSRRVKDLLGKGVEVKLLEVIKPLRGLSKNKSRIKAKNK